MSTDEKRPRRYSTERAHPSYTVEPCPNCDFPEADGGHCPDCGWTKAIVMTDGRPYVPRSAKRRAR